MIEKLKGKVQLHGLHLNQRDETSEQRAVRRAGQTDLQNDLEDSADAAAKHQGIEAAPDPTPVKVKTNTGEIYTDVRKPGYRPVTITREFNRPGDIATADSVKKTTGVK